MAKQDKVLERGRVGVSAGYSEYQVMMGTEQDRRRFQLTWMAVMRCCPA